MAKMTKTQAKRAYLAIKQKAGKLWMHGPWVHQSNTLRGLQMSTQDLVAIEKICDKYLKKF
jgi:hypothetical protein